MCTPLRRICVPLLLLGALLFLQGCTCCAYYNHMWNAHRAYEEAGDLRTARQDSLPGDSSRPAPEESKKYDRVIEKGSRTLERFPENRRQASMAVFLIAESYRHKGEWTKAILKYDELERYFPEHDSMPVAEYQRAWCLYQNKEYSISRFATERIIAKGPAQAFYVPALNLMSLLQEQANFPEQAIAALEQVLQSGSGSPFMRAKAHLRLAELYYRQQTWDKARLHYQAPEIAQLTPAEQYIAGKNAAECLFQIQEYSKAADEYEKLAQNPDYLPYLAEIQVRRGELLLLADNWTDGTKLLLLSTKLFPKTEYSARAFFDLGDFAQGTRKDFREAVLYYDSSYQSLPSSTWGRTSRERRDALNRLTKLQGSIEKAQKAQQPFFNEEFQIAELFLFKLTEVDSALHTLDRIVASTTDTLLSQRAAYARAFIFDEFKHDTLTADSLYRDLIARFPTSPFARQAQENLGIKVTVQTRADLAHSAFLRAESSWVAVQTIPVENIAEVDAAYARVLANYDSVFVLYPETSEGVHALYAKAQLLENEIGDTEGARTAYALLRDRHRNTPWGMAAEAKLSGRLAITDQELEQLRKRVKLLEESTDKMSKRYSDEAQKQQELQIKKPDEDDEELQNDYNSLYDFQ